MALMTESEEKQFQAFVLQQELAGHEERRRAQAARKNGWWRNFWTEYGGDLLYTAAVSPPSTHAMKSRSPPYSVQKFLHQPFFLAACARRRSSCPASSCCSTNAWNCFSSLSVISAIAVSFFHPRPQRVIRHS